jgi:hypothetical protein
MGWGYSLMVEHLPGMHEALGLVLSITNTLTHKQKEIETLAAYPEEVESWAQIL